MNASEGGALYTQYIIIILQNTLLSVSVRNWAKHNGSKAYINVSSIIIQLYLMSQIKS